MAIELNGTTGITTPDITSEAGLTVDGVSFASGAPANTLVTTSGGNVGVGTSSPGTKLDVRAGSVIQTIYNTDATGNDTHSAVIRAYAASTSYWNKLTLDGSGIVFNAYGTERARIDSSGNLCLNSTGYNNGKIVRVDDTNDRVRSMIVNNNNTGSSSRCGYIVNAYGNSWAMEMGSVAANGNSLNWTVDIFGSPTVRMALTTGGTATNSTGSWGTISDVRLKENVADATPKLDGLMQLRVVNYNLKSDPDVKMLGFVAQEVGQVFPGLVDSDGEMSEDGDRYKSVKTTVLIPMLIKAMQEQQAIIESLTARVVALEGGV